MARCKYRHKIDATGKCKYRHLPENAESSTAASESETHNPDGSANYVRFSEKPWGYDDYRAFIRSKGQDPDAVTFTWGWTSKPDGTGFWNKLNNVRPKAPTAPGMLDLDRLTDSVRNWTPTKKANGHHGPPSALVVSMADWQLGKGEGDGTPGTLRRLAHSLESILEYADKLRNVDHLILANMGDHTENVAGSYASQTHTVDLNMRDQLTLAVETNLAWIKALAPLFDKVTYAAALCNHGQLSRGQGRDNITDDADNATGLIGDTLKLICSSHDALRHIEWVIPRDEMITRVTAAGVNLPLSHGHKISGKEEDWLAKQSQYLTTVHRFIPDVWHTAHKHHAALTDFGPYTRIQATTVDPGSKWHTDATGMYSRPGTTTFLIGDHLPGKWAEYRIH
ncbi:MAG: hypothetical protein ACTHJM_16120 [Marmoricola sp.]